MSGALLGAAATALGVKSVLSGPLGAAAESPLNNVERGIDNATAVAVATSRTAVDQAQAQLQQAVTRSNVGSSPSLGPPGKSGSRSGPASVGPGAVEPSHRRAMVRRIIRDAAVRHGLDPKLLLALSYWESGWDQSRVSQTGAVGVMQVEPDTAAEAGPALLGRQVDLNDVYDNADIGAAVFSQYLEAYADPSLALAAYYQGPTSLRDNGMLPDTTQYVQGILDLAARISAGADTAQ